jgi:hypothetical protein
MPHEAAAPPSFEHADAVSPGLTVVATPNGPEYSLPPGLLGPSSAFPATRS